ncbi:MAG: hypothetical protein CMJ48_09345 [Planctomycetaceae bacterium]|nr:hypothetical protein [Planctomycetaceae bacterium]
MMTLETCPSPDDLQALSLGQLSEEQSDEVLGHLQACETCQAEMRTAAPMEDTLVARLRETAPQESYSDEAECQLALAKALGALANTSDERSDLEASSPIPKILGEYEIIRLIGCGGMGSVYLAQHCKLGRQVALKVLSSHRLLQPRMRERFEAEMRAVGQLSHPNIVTAHDAREIDEFAVLVTEYIDGLDVAQILRRTGPLSVANACEIARQTALALDYVDQQGLVHRDIKPSNVMIGKSGEVKLLDLGLARLQLGDEQSGMTSTGQAMGTADYIAPEQANDSRLVDIRADIYALGCTLFKMLSAQPPFDDERYPTVFAKMTAHVSEEPPQLDKLAPEVPADLVKLVHRMIGKDANDRPQSPREVAELLAKFSDWADLKQLVDQAIDAGDMASQPPKKRSGTPLDLQPEPKPMLQRRVPLLAAIASGLIGVLVGVALGIIITIKHPDGTTTQVEVPRGAAASVDKDGDVEIQLPGSDGQRTATTPNAQPLKVQPDPARLQGVWRAVAGDNVGRVPGQMILAFSKNQCITFMNGEAAQMMAFNVTTNDKFLTLSIKGPESVTMQATIEFKAGERMSMRTQGGTMELARISRFPITADRLKQVAADPETALFSATLQALAEYEKTGKLPIGGAMLTAKTAAMQSRSRRNLKELAIGLHNYHDTYRTFPAAVTNKRGNKMTQPVSWRVMILPFINESRIFEQYRLDEPWDSENNKKVLAQMPDVFRSPLMEKDSGDQTSTPYLAIVGPNTVLAEEPTALRDIRDGSSNTIMIVETKKAAPWTKPDDIAFQPDDELPKFEVLYKGGFHAARADGSTVFIDEKAKPDTLRAYITRDGGENVRFPQRNRARP